jgi:hypothetical protein
LQWPVLQTKTSTFDETHIELSSQNWQFPSINVPVLLSLSATFFEKKRQVN